jgi:plastocyanin
MTRSFRTAVAATALIAMGAGVLGACNTDGPDASEATGEDAATGEGASAGGLAPAAPSTTVPAVEPNGVIVDVAAIDNSFQAESIEVEVGTEVLWENRGRNEHDVLPAGVGEDWGVDEAQFNPGATYGHVFTTPGTFAYYCSIHGTAKAGMTGTVVVLPADG